MFKIPLEESIHIPEEIEEDIVMVSVDINRETLRLIRRLNRKSVKRELEDDGEPGGEPPPSGEPGAPSGGPGAPPSGPAVASTDPAPATATPTNWPPYMMELIRNEEPQAAEPVRSRRRQSSKKPAKD